MDKSINCGGPDRVAYYATLPAVSIFFRPPSAWRLPDRVAIFPGETYSTEDREKPGITHFNERTI